MRGIERRRTLSLGPPSGTGVAINRHEPLCLRDEPQTDLAHVVDVLVRSHLAFGSTVTARTGCGARQAQAAASLTPAGRSRGYASP